MVGRLMKRQAGRALPQSAILRGRFFLMVGRLMKRQAGRAEHFVAGIAALGMGLAHVRVTVAATLAGIVAAWITGRVLNT
jgi:hypothetical protein